MLFLVKVRDRGVTIVRVHHRQLVGTLRDDTRLVSLLYCYTPELLEIMLVICQVDVSLPYYTRPWWSRSLKERQGSKVH